MTPSWSENTVKPQGSCLSFTENMRDTTGFLEEQAVYLVFLKHDPHNRYQPTSGQVFSDHSVMALPQNGITMRPQ
jgi:hypothetical protein